MALKDLVITNEKISEDLIETVLKGRIELVQEGNKIILTREASIEPNKVKILLFLAGAKAWELLDKVNLSFLPGQMEVALNIPGNSLRPNLKELADNYLISGEKGKYQITTKGIYELQTTLENSANKEKTQGGIGQKIKRIVKSSNSGSNLPKAKSIEELINEGYFSSPRDNEEIIDELGRRGIMLKATSLPSFLLPLVRKKILTRDYKEKNKRKVWAYQKTNG